MIDEKAVAYLLNVGKPAKLESVDFDDPNRPKTCLEVDFPILSVNQVATIEGNAGKPIYQMSKWWARRRSSVFRSLLIAAATKAPSDESLSAKLVWDNYYKNHQKNNEFGNLKVADIFMGGGTTLVEGSRLGMQMYGNDLNPVAWFVVKQQFADVNTEDINRLLKEVEEKVRPQIIPFYYCDGPNGEKGTWSKKSTGEVMEESFDPLTLSPEEREDYSYEGPEIINTFWAKHSPCRNTNCDHITPLLPNPVIAEKSLTVRYWEHTCTSCGLEYDVEHGETRIAPDVPLYLNPDSKPFSVLSGKENLITCPNEDCGYSEIYKLTSRKTKKVHLSLLLHPDWMKGSPSSDDNALPYGGSPQDDYKNTARWNLNRSNNLRLLEVRGTLLERVICPETLVEFPTGREGGTIPRRSTFQCSNCGMQQDIRSAISDSKKGGPVAGYAIHAYSPKRSDSAAQYNGRFFSQFSTNMANQFNAAAKEWNERKDGDLAQYWPRSEVPYGFMTAKANGDIRKSYGFTHWWTMFNPRQLLVLSQLFKAIVEFEDYDWTTREYVLGAFQQYVRNQNMFCFWNKAGDKLEPHLSNNNFHPKVTMVENCVYQDLGRGNWQSACEGIIAGKNWAEDPWEIVSYEAIRRYDEFVSLESNKKSTKVYPRDALKGSSIKCTSSTDLSCYEDGSIDLIITDPPFGGLLHYSELSDFFYSWLRIPLHEKYPDIFESEFSPKSLEAVSNKAREPEDPDGFYQRLLTSCWRESYRILKKGGILAFTFHHSEDAPWVAVLESLFDAGFYLVATYPIRSDETKGEGEFGSKSIEYDIVHVCRKRESEPSKISWQQLRRQILVDVNQLQELLANHRNEGLPEADLQVIRRGKALEYFSRHYGKVELNNVPIDVKQALAGINLLIDEDINQSQEFPPAEAEPITRQFLRIFDNKTQLEKDQLQKMLRGSGITPDLFVERGWIYEKRRVYYIVDPKTIAQNWVGKHKVRLKSDLDQALVLIGACYEDSGINATDTIRNGHFKPHQALSYLLDWMSKRGQLSEIQEAAKKALVIFKNWNEKYKDLGTTHVKPLIEE